MTTITVTQTASTPKLTFDVALHDGAGSTRHTVTMDAGTFARLAGTSGVTSEDFVRAVFEFLLEREPKESILSRFDVTVVSRYFSEFEEEIGVYLGQSPKA